MKKLYIYILFCFLILFSCTNPSVKRPKLIISLVVDQMRPDLLTKYDDLYNGGFRWLIDHGKWFTNTHHEHGYTATGPGHFSIGSGQYPSKLAVLGNSFYDRDLKKIVNCVEDSKAKVIGSDKGKARSYSRYQTTALGDWIREDYPKSKIISIGGKDRTAVMLGGKNPNLVLYWNYNGSFISSDYYVQSLPNWVDAFNKDLNAESYKDSLWLKSLEEAVYLKYSRIDNFKGEEDTYLNETYSPVFPIGFNKDDDPKVSLMNKPWFEREVLKLAKLAIDEEKLGLDDSPDMLYVGFSAMDWMIHDYGPYSQEIMDALIKLDKYLGDFIDYIDQKIGLENVLFVTTADHGGLPLPEHLKQRGEEAGRINKNILNEALEWIDEEIEENYGKNLYYRNETNFFLNYQLLKKREITEDNIYKIIEKYLVRVDGIENVFKKSTILKSDSKDKITVRYKNMLHPDKSADIFSVVSSGYTYRNPYGTGHGSPYDYDTHVPLIFSQDNLKSNKVGNHTKTVDIAATLARILGIKPPEICDGDALDI